MPGAEYLAFGGGYAFFASWPGPGTITAVPQSCVPFRARVSRSAGMRSEASERDAGSMLGWTIPQTRHLAEPLGVQRDVASFGAQLPRKQTNVRIEYKPNQ